MECQRVVDVLGQPKFTSATSVCCLRRCEIMTRASPTTAPNEVSDTPIEEECQAGAARTTRDESAETSLLQASDDTRYRADPVWRSIRGGADQMILSAGAEDVEQFSEHLELRDDGVRVKQQGGYDL